MKFIFGVRVSICFCPRKTYQGMSFNLFKFLNTNL